MVPPTAAVGNPVPNVALALAIVLLRFRPAGIDLQSYVQALREAWPLPSSHGSQPAAEKTFNPSPSTVYYYRLFLKHQSQIQTLESELATLRAEKQSKERNAVGGWKKGSKCERNWGARLKEIEEERKVLGGIVGRTGSLGARLWEMVRRIGLLEGEETAEAVDEVVGALREVVKVIFDGKVGEDGKGVTKVGKQDTEKVLRAFEALWERLLFTYSKLDASPNSTTTARVLVSLGQIFDVLLDGIYLISRTIIEMMPKDSPVPEIRMGLMSLLLTTTVKLRMEFEHDRTLMEALLYVLLNRLSTFLVLPAPEPASEVLTDYEAAREAAWYYAHLLRGMWAVFGKYLDSVDGDSGRSGFVEMARRRLLERSWGAIEEAGGEVVVLEWAEKEIVKIFGWDAGGFIQAF